MFKLFFSVLYYEWLLFFRDKKTLIYSLGFYLIVALLFPIALSPYPDLLKKCAPGIVWIAALLSSLLALENWLGSDLEENALEQSLLCSFPLSWLIAAKLLAFWLAAALPLLIATPLLAFTLQLSLTELGILLLSLLAGTPALVALGAACKALTLSLRQQGSLLGLLVLPLTLPILILGVNTLIASSLSLPISGSLAFLSAISLLCFCLLPKAIAVVLRWGMEEQ